MTISSIRNLLIKETDYPERYRGKNLTKEVSVLFALIFLFLFLFRPFGVTASEHKFSYVVICLFHALSPSLIIFIYFRCLNQFNKVHPIAKKWSVIQEIIHLGLIFFLIGLFGFLMRSLIYTNPDNFSFRYFFEELKNGYITGLFFFIYLLFARSYFSTKTDLKEKEQVDTSSIKITIDSIKPATAIKPLPEIAIKTNVKTDDFSFNPQEFIYAKAEGNYVQFAVNHSSAIRTELKRISLTQLEAQLSKEEYLFRSHRAYLINLKKISQVSGNSQGYQVSFIGIADKIPVSRANIERFDRLFETSTA